MLVKKFIDDVTVQELFNWTNNQKLGQNKTNGHLSFLYYLENLNNYPLCLNKVREKCKKLIDGIYQEPIHKDFILEIFENGYVNEHTDLTTGNYKHLRCNILLQKPEKGGKLIFNKNVVDLDVGDMYIVDTSILHAVSKVQGNKDYKSIVFGFLCKN
jgi:hypothetical protein